MAADCIRETVLFQGDRNGYCIGGVVEQLLQVIKDDESTTFSNLLPANSVIDCVIVRIKGEITGPTACEVGVSEDADAFGTVGLTSGETIIPLCYENKTEDDVKLTYTVSPVESTSDVHVTVFYRKFVSPTSAANRGSLLEFA